MTDELDVRFRWDIDDVPGYGSVMFRGEGDTGYPTQTWVDGALLEREPGGIFAWATDDAVPLAVHHMDLVADRWKEDLTTLCYVLRLEVALWEKQHSSSEASLARCAAFAEYGRRLLAAASC